MQLPVSFSTCLGASGARCYLWLGVGASLFISLTSSTARKFNVPLYSLLGGKVRDKIQVYAWIGGDRPTDVENQAYYSFHLTWGLNLPTNVNLQ